MMKMMKMMKKMKDDDIIKTLDLCSKRSLKQYLCPICPLQHENCYGGALIKLLALDLINRQKAEIDRLRESAKTLSDALADIEEVHARWEPYQTPIETRQSGWICTNCSGVQKDLNNGDTEYCPHCGAIMDGGEQDG